MLPKPTSRRHRQKGRIKRLMARVDLRRVAKARRKLEAAQVELRASILDAVASGETHRDVARFASLSQQRIQQIVRESKDF